MSNSDKAEEYKGKAKEAWGDLTEDRDLKNEGQTDQASSKAKQNIDNAAEKVKDAADKVKDKLTGN